MNITIGDLTSSLRRKLSEIYGAGEAAAMVRLIFHALKGWNNTRLIINSDLPASEFLISKTADILARLLRHEPIQYILGETYFYGMDLKVSPATLIPRPETEQLVDLIVSENQKPDLEVLDIGTGSGAIAIALARNLPFSHVTALDISADALQIAKDNAQTLHAKVDYLNCDIFKYTPPTRSLDIIVSNPPYVDDSERNAMEPNVLDYEPHLALFVPDDNPLLFYKRIAALGTVALKPQGRLYLEINPRHDIELKQLLENSSYTSVEIIKDIHGKSRFISCIWQ